MNVDDLKKLPLEQLRKIRNKNLLLFNLLAIGDLTVFYHSLHTEKWFLLFVAFGIFVACISLYDNYKIADDLLPEKQRV